MHCNTIRCCGFRLGVFSDKVMSWTIFDHTCATTYFSQPTFHIFLDAVVVASRCSFSHARQLKRVNDCTLASQQTVVLFMRTPPQQASSGACFPTRTDLNIVPSAGGAKASEQWHAPEGIGQAGGTGQALGRCPLRNGVVPGRAKARFEWLIRCGDARGGPRGALRYATESAPAALQCIQIPPTSASEALAASAPTNEYRASIDNFLFDEPVPLNVHRPSSLGAASSFLPPQPRSVTGCLSTVRLKNLFGLHVAILSCSARSLSCKPRNAATRPEEGRRCS